MGIRSVLRRIKTLYRNLRILSSKPISEIQDDTTYSVLLRLEKQMEVARMDAEINILSDEETWDLILNEPKSFIRIGDGELTLIGGRSIAFQKYDEALAAYLKEILSSDREDFYLGIEYNYFHGFGENTVPTVRRHNYLNAVYFKKTLLDYCGNKSDKTYISASFNQKYVNNVSFDKEAYLEKMRSLMKERDLVVFSGKGILDGLSDRLFDHARSVEYVDCPAQDAFDSFNDILEKARHFSKDKVLCFILGPTSKPLVYELSKGGYMAWDLGHMAKDYDACMKNAERTDRFIMDFFAPD